jgi:type I restriction enzyme, S subunit
VKSEKTLGDICFIEKGNIGIQAALPGSYPLVTTAAERSSHNEYSFDGEAVCIPLVSATGHGHASIKRIHFQKGKFSVGNILCACVPKDYTKTSAKFLHLYLSLLKDDILVPLMQGSANVSLKIKDLEKVPIPNISHERQVEIVDEFERLELIHGKLLSEVGRQQEYLRLLRQTILQEAIQGKLTKQNPKEEPAIVLLQRIKGEKEKLIKAGKLKKEKELPPITEDEIPYELPPGWVWCRLGEVVTLITKGSSPKWQGVNYVENGVLFVTSENVLSYNIDLSKKKFVEWKFNKIEPRSVLKKGDYLMNIVGGSIGRTAIYDIDEIANINQAVCLIRKDTNLVNSRYLLDFFNSSVCLRYMFDKQVDNARPNLSMGNIAKFPIPLPPLSEQHRIVLKVQQLQKHVSQLENEVTQSRQYAEQLLQSVLNEAFEKSKATKNSNNSRKKPEPAI